MKNGFFLGATLAVALAMPPAATAQVATQYWTGGETEQVCKSCPRGYRPCGPGCCPS